MRGQGYRRDRDERPRRVAARDEDRDDPRPPREDAPRFPRRRSSVRAACFSPRDACRSPAAAPERPPRVVRPARDREEVRPPRDELRPPPREDAPRDVRDDVREDRADVRAPRPEDRRPPRDRDSDRRARAPPWRRDRPRPLARRDVRRPSARASAVSRPTSLLKLERCPPEVRSSKTNARLASSNFRSHSSHGIFRSLPSPDHPGKSIRMIPVSPSPVPMTSAGQPPRSSTHLRISS